MKQTYHGSCHCGRVRFEAELDLADGSFRCNCSFCRMTRSWLAVVRPEDFRLLEGEAALTRYAFGTHAFRHPFCSHCGVHAFSRVDDDSVGGTVFMVNLTCLDDVSDAELADVFIDYLDGRNDNFQATPKETAWL